LAVYKRSYRTYTGALTNERLRFLILPRFAYERVFAPKYMMGLLVASAFFPLACAVYIYAVNNLEMLKSLGLPVGNMFKIDADFFRFFLTAQAAFGYFLTALIGPSLIAPDLTNNALPAYFSRPFSRTEYVIGKMSVLVLLLSVIMWVPGLFLFFLQASQAGWDWTRENWYLGRAVLLGSLVYIFLLSLIAIALSAWVKWKQVAGGLILGVFMIGGGLAAMVNSMLQTEWGSLLDLSRVMTTIWSSQFRMEANTGLEPLEAWVTFFAVCAICLLMLERKIRPKEIVK
jgi:ABC-2 type transport system permease protein